MGEHHEQCPGVRTGIAAGREEVVRDPFLSVPTEEHTGGGLGWRSIADSVPELRRNERLRSTLCTAGSGSRSRVWQDA